MSTEYPNFHGCYLLYNGRKTYVGYTVNPLRRIKQHNLGRDKGGAKKTSDKGPWYMVLIVYGFMSNIAALQFEWAWQHPTLSKKLKTIASDGILKKSPRKQDTLQYKFSVLGIMLATGPWDVLPLTVRWIDPKYETHLGESVPRHVMFLRGPFEDKRQFNKNPKRVVPARNELYLPSACFFCEADLKNEKDNFAFCINAEAQCSLQSHLTCWAEQSLSSVATRSLVPLEAECPKCGLQSLWGDVITFKMNLSSAVHDQRNLEELQEGPLSQEIESHDNSLSDLLTLLD